MLSEKDVMWFLQVLGLSKREIQVYTCFWPKVVFNQLVYCQTAKNGAGAGLSYV